MNAGVSLAPQNKAEEEVAAVGEGRRWDVVLLRVRWEQVDWADVWGRVKVVAEAEVMVDLSEDIKEKDKH